MCVLGGVEGRSVAIGLCWTYGGAIYSIQEPYRGYSLCIWPAVYSDLHPHVPLWMQHTPAVQPHNHRTHAYGESRSGTNALYGTMVGTWSHICGLCAASAPPGWPLGRWVLRSTKHEKTHKKSITHSSGAHLLPQMMV